MAKNNGTREMLVRAAVQLFAEQGIDAVSLAQINRAAGQRNATAAHYHFGGKAGLVQAIFDKHRSRVDVLRETMLADLPEQASLKQVLAVLIVPLAEQVRDADGGIHYLRFLAQIMNRGEADGGAVDQHDSPALQEQSRRFQIALRDVPVELAGMRMGFVVTMIFNSLARYAQSVSQQGLDEDRHSVLIEQLTAAAAGALAITPVNMSH